MFQTVTEDQIVLSEWHQPAAESVWWTFQNKVCIIGQHGSLISTYLQYIPSLKLRSIFPNAFWPFPLYVLEATYTQQIQITFIMSSSLSNTLGVSQPSGRIVHPLLDPSANWAPPSVLCSNAQAVPKSYWPLYLISCVSTHFPPHLICWGHNHILPVILVT